MQSLTTRQLAIAGLVASSYAILSLVFQPISFGVYQVRVAEALTVLPFLSVAAVPGLYIGCLVANILGGLGWMDILFGPLITLLAAILTRLTVHLRSPQKANYLTYLPLILMWLGAVFLLNNFTFSTRPIIGIFVSLVAITMIWLGARRLPLATFISRDRFWSMVIFALVLTMAAIILLEKTREPFFAICGGLLLLATVFGAAVLVWTRNTGHEIGIILAPLPPVILNAFGVSLYLAPIIGVNYWFCVQMIGVGQLIACYIIGLPILLILRRRNIFG